MEVSLPEYNIARPIVEKLYRLNAQRSLLRQTLLSFVSLAAFRFVVSLLLNFYQQRLK